MTTKTHAFSLIEVLVLAAVLAVLVVALVPTLLARHQTVTERIAVDAIYKQIVDSNITDSGILAALGPYEGKVTYRTGQTPAEVGEMLIEANKIHAIMADPQTQSYANALPEPQTYGTVTFDGRTAALYRRMTREGLEGDIQALKSILGANPPKMKISGYNDMLTIETYETQEVLRQAAEITLHAVSLSRDNLAALARETGVADAEAVKQILANK